MWCFLYVLQVFVCLNSLSLFLYWFTVCLNTSQSFAATFSCSGVENELRLKCFKQIVSNSICLDLVLTINLLMLWICHKCLVVVCWLLFCGRLCGLIWIERRSVFEFFAFFFFFFFLF